MTSTIETPRQRVADLILAGAFLALTQIEVWVFSLGEDGRGIGFKLGASLTTAIASAALAWRRSRPGPSYALNAAGVIGAIALGFPSDVYQWTNLIAMYSVGAYGSNLQRWAALPAGVGGVLFYFYRFPFEGGAALVAFLCALWVVGWLAGRIYGARLDEIQLRHEMELSRQLAEANQQRLVLEEERIRIARELHDIVGHTVNVMVVHAGAGRREIGGDEALVRQAFDTIESTGRAAMNELDRVLALLRREGVDTERLPMPGIGDLPELATTFVDAGLDVEIGVSGLGENVPASVGLAAYRIVQEALTNTLRHGSARRAVVTVDVDDIRLDISAVDDGTGDASSIHPGRGIVGMKERAALHDGTVTIEGADGGGVAVRATLNWEGEGE
jgi:signal transduction histidine kinase